MIIEIEYLSIIDRIIYIVQSISLLLCILYQHMLLTTTIVLMQYFVTHTTL